LGEGVCSNHQIAITWGGGYGQIVITFIVAKNVEFTVFSCSIYGILGGKGLADTLEYRYMGERGIKLLKKTSYDI